MTDINKEIQLKMDKEHLLTIGSNNLEAIKNFLNTDPKPNIDEILLSAAENNQEEVVKALLNYRSDYLQQKINDLNLRIKANLDKLNSSHAVPSTLAGLIAADKLRAIYNKIFFDSTIQQQLRETLGKGKPLRLSKEFTGLARTVNVIFDPETGDMCLLLETKSKRVGEEANNKPRKDKKNTPKFSGTSKTAKPAYRIDSEEPIKYANAVFYATQEFGLQELTTESSVSKNVVKDSATETFLNLTEAGAKIRKKGKRSTKNSANNQPYRFKQSVYSKWASGGDLNHFIREMGAVLTLKQKNSLAAQLLIAVQAMHKKVKIHQDIKTNNILVFEDAPGNYRLELADFGASFDSKKPLTNRLANASRTYESPEISASHRKDSPHHEYYYQADIPSYGRDVAATKDLKALANYKNPNEANDMWAVGVVLHELYRNGAKPTESSIGIITKKANTAPQLETASPLVLVSQLITGLLNPDRNQRFDADKALAFLPPITKAIIPVSHPQVTLNTTNEAGNTPLMLAAKNGHLSMVITLLAEELDLNQSNQMGQTALMLAVQEGHLEVVKALKEAKGVDLYAVDKDGCTSLTLAIKNNSPEIIKILIEGRLNVAVKNALLGLAETQNNRGVNNQMVVKKLLQMSFSHGVNIENGLQSVFELAITMGHWDIVKAFIEEDLKRFSININQQDVLGDTLLMSALKHGHLEIAKDLIAIGADTTIKNGTGETALHFAIRYGHIEIVQLIEAKEKANRKLLKAASEGDLKQLQSAISKLEHVNLVDEEGYTPLMLACEQNPENEEQEDEERHYLEVVQTLIAAGANVNAVSKDGKTALIWAVNNEKLEIVEALLEAGANVAVEVLNEEGEIDTVMSFIGQNDKDPIYRVLKTALDKAEFCQKWGNLELTKNSKSAQQEKSASPILFTFGNLKGQPILNKLEQQLSEAIISLNTSKSTSQIAEKTLALFQIIDRMKAQQDSEEVTPNPKLKIILSELEQDLLKIADAKQIRTKQSTENSLKHKST
jgi:ankyrin repeat protein